MIKKQNEHITVKVFWARPLGWLSVTAKTGIWRLAELGRLRWWRLATSLTKVPVLSEVIEQLNGAINLGKSSNNINEGISSKSCLITGRYPNTQSCLLAIQLILIKRFKFYSSWIQTLEFRNQTQTHIQKRTQPANNPVLNPTLWCQQVSTIPHLVYFFQGVSH